MTSLSAYEKFRAKTLAFAEATRPARMCWLFHRWGPWVDVMAYSVMSKDGRAVGDGVEQHRRCERCNRLQVRRVQSTILDGK